jgi:aspartyl-tRNA(Asn)/glutamyl-tRNA(Gln) amidotransferase subunit C
MISREEVEQVAQMARLYLSEDELTAIRSALSQTIEYAKEIVALDLTGVEPTVSTADLKNVLREDVPVASLSNEEAVGNAPDVERGQFVVPQIG